MTDPLATAPELADLGAVATAFAQDRLGAARGSLEQAGVVGPEMVDALGRAGLLDVGIAEEHGGQGGGLPAALVVVERLARVCPTAAMVVVHTHAAARIGQTAEPPRSLAFGSAAPDGGAAVTRVDLGLPVEAVHIWDGGNRAALVARDAIVVTEAPGRTGLPGLGAATASVAGPVDWRPAAGEVGRWWRWGIAAAALGAAAGAAAHARSYGAQRHQFGGPLTALPAYAARLDALAASLATMARVVADPDAPELARRRVLDDAVAVTLAAVQLYGGYGYLREYGVEGLARDAISLRAAGLTG
ncbi:acyl-CoA dehydrogenase family protein [Solwaraspora sp. WMMD1047]|uniref:acyl-CoA dehydrogenase family protein n=1 Tax=Solwaraspora sp. WMMD1047 TaxID=3016102 RepID=UPI002417B662|nr:acyl-CoA dehydrogenase family protein [Solwaraspora sp. WMMD1047]MDG4834318.1 acyl-CoA dehydrogenase family protein [Solwaraspora sp. WMMD1047]